MIRVTRHDINDVAVYTASLYYNAIVLIILQKIKNIRLYHSRLKP